MGFKIIREPKEGKEEKIFNEQLLKETVRWTNITDSAERVDGFLERFKIVKSAKKPKLSPDEMAELLSSNIRQEYKSLSQTQGNIDLERLKDLLS